MRSPRATWLARNDCAEAIQKGEADLLFAGAARREPAAGGGRGGLVRLRLAGQEAVGKRALHGGLLGRILGGLYLGAGRAVAQLVAAERLERAGVPTPAVLAVGWRRAFGPFHQHAVVTRRVHRSQNLYEAALEDAPWRRRRISLEKSASLVRSMHDAGFLHADLNVSNILLGEGPDGDRVHIVDLDRGRFVRRAGPGARFRNLARLLRSYEKWIAGRFRLTAREELLFLRSYCGPDRSLLRRLQRRLQRYRGRLRLRRILWGGARAPQSGRANAGRWTAQK
ncbi:MAG: lipopolysaccharide kinase InaA family protein [Acidobacteriota bacterium]